MDIKDEPETETMRMKSYPGTTCAAHSAMEFCGSVPRRPTTHTPAFDNALETAIDTWVQRGKQKQND